MVVVQSLQFQLNFLALRFLPTNKLVLLLSLSSCSSTKLDPVAPPLAAVPVSAPVSLPPVAAPVPPVVPVPVLQPLTVCSTLRMCAASSSVVPPVILELLPVSLLELVPVAPVYSICSSGFGFGSAATGV